MTGPVDPPRWRALEIGPGGLPADQLMPVGPGAPTGQARPVSTGATNGADRPWPVTPDALRGDDRPRPVTAGALRGDNRPEVLPASWQNWARSVTPPPRRGPSNSTVYKIAGAFVVLAVVIGLGVWANRTSPLHRSGSTAQIAVGDCLSSTGQRIGGEVDCSSDSADFSVVGRYPDTSDASECSASPSDVAVVAPGPTVLCLDYVAAVGDCLFAGTGTNQVGKVDCDSTLPGVYRVTAVLENSIDPDACPDGTSQTLVHLHNSEVICLLRG